MPAQFFTSWEIWKKLVFVLACMIVLTLLLGCAKLLHAHWRLRKYQAAAEQEREDQAMQRQMSQRRPASATASDEVPFGIRAIERGVEIEGVWISRGNTPELPSSQDSSPASSLWDHVPRKEFHVDLEKQEPRPRSPSNSTVTTARPDQTSLDRVTSAEDISSAQPSRESSPAAPITKPSRAKYPPLSYNKYAGGPYLFRRQSNTTSTLNALEAIYHASTSIHGEDTGSSESSTQSSDSTGDSGPISSSAPSLLSYQPTPRPRPRQQQSSTDLELLNRHRTSQVAETGQLTPRGRRPGYSHSVDFSRPSKPRRESTSQERTDYFAPPRPTNGASLASPYHSPKIDALPAAVRRSSMPDVTPFTEFCKRAPPNSRPESMRSSSRDSTPSASVAPSPFASPIIPASEGTAELTLPPLAAPAPTRPRAASTWTFDRPASQVIRGHGTGFEILRQGSLNPPLPTAQTAPSPNRPPRSRRSNTCDSSEGKMWRVSQKKRGPMESAAGVEGGGGKRFSLFL